MLSEKISSDQQECPARRRFVEVVDTSLFVRWLIYASTPDAKLMEGLGRLCCALVNLTNHVLTTLHCTLDHPLDLVSCHARVKWIERDDVRPRRVEGFAVYFEVELIARDNATFITSA